MYRIKKILLALVIVSIFFPAFALGDVPGLMSYQGILKDAEGDPVTTITTVIMTIYDDATASDPANIKWQETHLVTPDENGLFSVILGQGVVPISLTDDVFDGPDRWLGVQIQGDDEQSPRTRIVTSAFSHRVSTIDGSSGGVISGDVTIASDLSVDGDLNITGKATIGTGHTNSGIATFVAGENNTANNDYAVAGGGKDNIVSGISSIISGGESNETSADYNTICGGYNNSVQSDYGVVCGGINNTVIDENWSAICGGYGNTIQRRYSFIGGGSENYTRWEWSVIGGGLGNQTQGARCVVAGGDHNTAGDAYTGTGNWATVGGGLYNNAAADYSVVTGGIFNSASGIGSMVPGGQSNVAAGFASFAAGLRAKANHKGVFVWADSTGTDFSSTGDNQFIVRASGGVGIGTNAPTAALHVNGEAKCEVGGVEFYMVPQGAIIMWSGSLASIPSGWALCDGSNGTPNLSDRFIYSVHSGENPGATGGSATIPAHYHSVYHDHAAVTTGNNSASQTVLELGGWGVARNPHTHVVDVPGMTVNSSTDGAASNIPPYYKLAFIMKL